MNTPSTESQEQASNGIPPKSHTSPVSLSPSWRRLSLFLRRLPGHFLGRFIRPIIGFGFDVSGGIYRIDGCQFQIPVHLTDRNFRSAFVLGEYEMGGAEIDSAISASRRPRHRIGGLHWRPVLLGKCQIKLANSSSGCRGQSRTDPVVDTSPRAQSSLLSDRGVCRFNRMRGPLRNSSTDDPWRPICR